MREEGLSHLFPSFVRIARLDPADLAMPGARARAVTSLGQAVSDDPSIFSPSASLEEAVAKLRSLPGIGEWTAQYIAMRELREPDAFPAADIGLLRAMTDKDSWRPWRAYAALHLWAAGSGPLLAAETTDEREAA
jgi:AraC family transcriptional regulator of adaptative response / DNA-3-methyladenine glycosylase II